MSPPHHPELMDFLQSACRPPHGLSFADFMATALYHPDWGYYASGRAGVGRDGDYFTSVSVGPCFGRLLALRIAAWWEENQRPARWILMEQGTHDGRLLADILATLPSEALAAAEIRVIEPFPAMRARQVTTLAPWIERVGWYASPGESPPPGCPVVFIANELLDAFPVERLLWRGEKWHRLHVIATGDAGRPFGWLPMPMPEAPGPLAPPPHADAFPLEIARTGDSWPARSKAFPVLPGRTKPESRRRDRDGLAALREQDWAPPPTVPARVDGSITEIRPAIYPWCQDLARAMPSGLAILIDYGFEAHDYHHPSRSDGTLRTYHRHRAIDDPFAAVGNSDITAHVEWTSVAAALQAAGFSPSPLLDQGRWLTRIAAPWLLGMDSPPTPDQAHLLRQFQTLVHPQQMGGKFQVLEAVKPPQSVA